MINPNHIYPHSQKQLLEAILKTIFTNADSQIKNQENEKNNENPIGNSFKLGWQYTLSRRQMKPQIFLSSMHKNKKLYSSFSVKLNQNKHNLRMMINDPLLAVIQSRYKHNSKNTSSNSFIKLTFNKNLSFNSQISYKSPQFTSLTKFNYAKYFMVSTIIKYQQQIYKQIYMGIGCSYIYNKNFFDWTIWGRSHMGSGISFVSKKQKSIGLLYKRKQLSLETKLFLPRQIKWGVKTQVYGNELLLICNKFRFQNIRLKFKSLGTILQAKIKKNNLLYSCKKDIIMKSQKFKSKIIVQANSSPSLSLKCLLSGKGWNTKISSIYQTTTSPRVSLQFNIYE